MRQKILTMCQGGNVRSVALRHLLVYGDLTGGYGYGCRDVIACGWQTNTDATRDMLYQWADTICVMHEPFKLFVPEKYWKNPDGTKRLFVVNLGEDVWRNPFHPEIEPLLRQRVIESGLHDELLKP